LLDGFRRPRLSRPTLGFLLLAVVCAPFLSDFLLTDDHALAGVSSSVPPPMSGPFRIIRPADGAIISNGNLFLIEGVIETPTALVDVAFDAEDRRESAAFDARNPSHWTYLWNDPSPGFQRIRARATTNEGAPSRA